MNFQLEEFSKNTLGNEKAFTDVKNSVVFLMPTQIISRVYNYQNYLWLQQKKFTTDSLSLSLFQQRL